MFKIFLIIWTNLMAIFLFAQSTYLAEVQQKLKNAAAYTLEIAESMPEDRFDFRPMASEMSFGEQLLHIVGNMNWLTSSYLGGKKSEKDLKKTDYTKAETIAVLKEIVENATAALNQLQAEQLDEKVEFFAGPMTKRQILTLLNDHHTHHRGQLIVYLRLNNIKPPKYLGW